MAETSHKPTGPDSMVGPVAEAVVGPVVGPGTPSGTPRPLLATINRDQPSRDQTAPEARSRPPESDPRRIHGGDETAPAPTPPVEAKVESKVESRVEGEVVDTEADKARRRRRRERERVRQEEARKQEQVQAQKRANETKAPTPPEPEPAPLASPQTPAPVTPQASQARLKTRHIVVALSFALLVVIPLALTSLYLGLRAQDQYASRVGFAVRSEEAASASSLLGGLMGFSGSSGGDTDILYRYLQSQDMADRVDRDLDLKAIYARGHASDPVFALDPDASSEDVLRYWNRMVKVFYDNRTGLIEARVNAFTPEDAQRIARTILTQSTATINELSAIAREDATGYARQELDLAERRVRETRVAVADFRARTQMVDPTADVAGQMALLATLQGQLAEALIESDLLRQGGAKADDPRSTQTARRIGVINERILSERAKLSPGMAQEAVPGSAPGAGPGLDPSMPITTQNYAGAIGEYERLRVEQEFAEKSYLASLASYDVARAEAQRKSRYLATYIQPTLAQTAEYPRRALIITMAFVFLTLAWAVFVLVYYAIRDRR